jgi:flagellar biogenesis protein FliO
MRVPLAYFLWLIIILPIGVSAGEGVALAGDGVTRAGQEATVSLLAESQTDQQQLPFKQTENVKASFFKVLIVFLLMIALAYAGIRFLKYFQTNGLANSKKSMLVKILESRRLDTKTSVHVISVKAECFLVAQNGHGLQVIRLDSNSNVDEKIEQQG